jgi:hypothetical protein
MKKGTKGQRLIGTKKEEEEYTLAGGGRFDRT